MAVSIGALAAAIAGLIAPHRVSCRAQRRRGTSTCMHPEKDRRRALYDGKKQKCKKQRKRRSPSTRKGPAGQKRQQWQNGSNGAAGQPQKALSFSTSAEAGLFESA